MYEVFLKTKVLLFSLPGKIQSDSCARKIIQEREMKSTQLMLNELEADTEFDSYVIESESPDKTFAYFYMSLKIIAAAGGLVQNDKGELLMIFRRGHWDLPKGKIDSGETEEQSALREVNEETGLTGLSIVNRLNPSFHAYRIGKEWILKETHWFLMHTSIPSVVKPQVEEGITKVRWFDSNGYTSTYELLFPSLKSLVDDYFKA